MTLADVKKEVALCIENQAANRRWFAAFSMLCGRMLLEKLEVGGIAMLIDFNQKEEITIPGMNNGTGTMTAKMYMD